MPPSQIHRDIEDAAVVHVAAANYIANSRANVVAGFIHGLIDIPEAADGAAVGGYLHHDQVSAVRYSVGVVILVVGQDRVVVSIDGKLKSTWVARSE